MGSTVHVRKSPFPCFKYEDRKISVFLGWFNGRYIQVSVLDQEGPTDVFSVDYEADVRSVDYETKPRSWGNPGRYKPGRWVDYLRMVHEKMALVKEAQEAAQRLQEKQEEERLFGLIDDSNLFPDVAP